MHLNSVNWLDGTDSGVYVLCPESRVADWEGTQGFTALEEYVSTIVLPGHGEILTIGGEALPVTYVPDLDRDCRWPSPRRMPSATERRLGCGRREIAVGFLHTPP